MQTGMLWFDNSKTGMEEKVRQAADYYQKKYGLKATVCFAPAGTEAMSVNGIQVREDKTVLPNHLWIGVEEK